MADEIIEETQTEGTTEIPSEGTTGNGYLTKPYLVRNLQTFWSKIKEYIKNQEFVNEDTVKGALLSKAEASALKDLETTVTDKVSQAELTERLAGKVDAEQGKGLSTNDFTNVFRNKLNNLPASVATYADMGFMSADDKQKLDDLVVNAVKTVDNALSTTSTNPVQNAVIYTALDGKANKENLEDPSDLANSEILQGYSTEAEGHIVLIVPKSTKHLKIYAPNSDRPIEKVSFKDQNEVLFTNFQENDDETLAITIENPEGKDGDTWNINEYTSFNFYIESLIVENKKYKPFILEALRGDEYNLTKIKLNIVKIF